MRAAGFLLLAGLALLSPPARANDASEAQHSYAKGLELARHRQFQEAATQFETVLTLRPGDQAALAQLGHCRYYLGDKAGALDAYERYLAKNPSPDPRIAALAQDLRKVVAPTPQPSPLPTAPPAALDKDLVGWVEAETAMDQSKSTGKPLLFDFTAAWCGPCKRMAKEVFGSTEHAAWINEHFVPVRVMDRRVEDGHNPSITASLQKRYSLRAFPTLVVDTPGVSFLVKHHSTVGYMNVETTREFLEKALAALKK